MRGNPTSARPAPEGRGALCVLPDAETLRVKVAERAARERDVAVASFLQKLRCARIVARDLLAEARTRRPHQDDRPRPIQRHRAALVMERRQVETRTALADVASMTEEIDRALLVVGHAAAAAARKRNRRMP